MSSPLFDPSKMRVARERRTDGAGPPPAPTSDPASSPTPGGSAADGSSAPPPPAPAVRALSVSQLAASIGDALRGLPSPVRVTGEVSGARCKTHWYFDLKDAGAVISCVMFASSARRSPAAPRDGEQVVVTGRVEFFGRQGRTQLYVDSVRTVGEGAIDAELRRRVEEARRLGWLDEARKRPLPAFPRRVAVVTSRGSAAVADVIDTARRRCRATDLLLCDVTVQGDGAARAVATALQRLGRDHERLGVDVIIVTRGGGSKEDLHAFNDMELARTIVQSPVPIVAAIGHEIDTTLAELVADRRAATPTQAALVVVPDAEALDEQLGVLASRLRAACERRIERGADRVRTLARSRAMGAPVGTLIERRAERLEGLGRSLSRESARSLSARAHGLEVLSGRLEAFRPAGVYAARRSRLREAERSLARAMRHHLERVGPEPVRARLEAAMGAGARARGDRLERAARSLELIGPARVLARGYSVTLDESGGVVRSVAQAPAGARLRTRVGDGSIASTVDGAGTGEPKKGTSAGPDASGPRNEPKNGPRARSSPTRRAKGPGGQDEDGGAPQMDLFAGRE